MLGKDDQQKGSDLPEKRKTRLPAIPSPPVPDLISFSRWRWCYKSRGAFPAYLALEVQKQSNAPVPGQKLATVESQQIPRYAPVCPRGQPPEWPLISAIVQCIS